MKIILASSSKLKSDLLDTVGIKHSCIGTEEPIVDEEDFYKFAMAKSLGKAKSVKAEGIIIGLDSLLLKLSADAKSSYDTLVETANMIQTIKFIFIDTIDIFKKVEYDNWYKAIVKNNQGIWIGNGISEQYTLKLSKITRELQEDVDLGFGYVIRRGIPVLTKFITSESGYRSDDYE